MTKHWLDKTCDRIARRQRILARIGVVIIWLCLPIVIVHNWLYSDFTLNERGPKP